MVLDIQKPEYWSAVKTSYKSLGGTYKSAGKLSAPTNSELYTLARLLAATGSRICAVCKHVHAGKPGQLYKHCGKLMVADLSASDRDQIVATVGRVKMNMKSAATKPNPGPYSDNTWDKIEKSDAEGEARLKERQQKRKEKNQPKLDAPSPEEDKKTTAKAEGEYYSDYDDESGLYCVFHTESDHCFSTFSSASEAKAEADDLNQKGASRPKYTARFIQDTSNLGDSHWIVKHGSNPVLKVTLAQAFPNNIETKAAKFSTQAYGDSLISNIAKSGVEGAVKTALNGRATVFKVGQINPMAPNIFSEETNVEDQDQQGNKPSGDQADSAMVDPDAGDDILEDKPDNSDVINTLKELFVPVLNLSEDMTVDNVVQEIKLLVQNEEALSEFQGSLQEMVDSSRAAGDAKDEEESEEESAEADAGAATPPPDQQPMLTAQKEERRRVNAELHRNKEVIRKLQAQLSAQEDALTAERQANLRLSDENKLLLTERTMRIRYPRCLDVAVKQVEIGEVVEADKDKHVIALLKMPTEQFEATELRVGRVFERVGSVGPGVDTTGILSAIPEQMDGNDANLKSGPRSGGKSLQTSWTGAVR
jgi:hypothetical protein